MGILVQVLTQNLNQERRKSDRLLLNVLPETIAQELKQTDRVQPIDYESASVLFTDFVGFTQIAEGFTPQQLIEELDSCFSRFDLIAKKHKLEKIKTIGDAYMAVGGVPVTNRTHAVDCVLAALEIEQVVSRFREQEMAESRPYWQIRVGIHSGDLVAGVVGREKFAYDVWGDTVNTASRLESSGVAGRINISGTTYHLVKEFFDCEFRGKIAAKNKGEIEMYFVNGIRPELAIDSTTPNERFYELYQRLRGGTTAGERPGLGVSNIRVRSNWWFGLWTFAADHVPISSRPQTSEERRVIARPRRDRECRCEIHLGRSGHDQVFLPPGSHPRHLSYLQRLFAGKGPVAGPP